MIRRTRTPGEKEHFVSKGDVNLPNQLTKPRSGPKPLLTQYVIVIFPDKFHLQLPIEEVSTVTHLLPFRISNTTFGTRKWGNQKALSYAAVKQQ